MRHGKKVNHLGRTSSHRSAMLSNMASSLILHKRISTTVAKAKALRKYVEPLITKAKDDSTHSRRMVFSYLQDKTAVTELFREISQKVGDRPGGYTRILRTGFRVGDAAEMCIIELVDYNDNYTQNKGGKRAKAKTTRRGRGKGKSETPVIEEVKELKEEVTEITEVTEVAEETPLAEEAPAVVDAEIVEEIPADVAEKVTVAEEPPVQEVTEEIPTAEAVVAETPAAEVAEETPAVEAEATAAEEKE